MLHLIECVELTIIAGAMSKMSSHGKLGQSTIWSMSSSTKDWGTPEVLSRIYPATSELWHSKRRVCPALLGHPPIP